MSAEITPACRAEVARQPDRPAGDDRGTLGTLSWPRAAKIAGLAGAVAVLAALSAAAGHVAQVAPQDRTRTASVVTPQRAPAPARAAVYSDPQP